MVEPLIIKVTKEMRELAEEKAKERALFKRKHSKDLKAVVKNKALENEITGLIGEIVIGSLLGLEPDYALYKRKGGKPHDFEYQGKKLSVKSTANPAAELLLLFPEEIEDDIDIYIAVKIVDDQAYIMGYETRDEMKKVGVKLFIYGPRVKKKYTELKSFQEFMDDLDKGS